MDDGIAATALHLVNLPTESPQGSRRADPLGRAQRASCALQEGGCTFRDILAAVGIAPGNYQRPDPAITAQRDAEQRAEGQKRE